MSPATRQLRVILAASAAFYTAFILRSLFDVDGVLHSTLYNAAREGLLFRDTLAPEATLASSWAGSIPYVAEHTTIDMLGKNDRGIAQMAPVIPEFVPGHNKWNLRYSIGELRPDLACNLPRRPGEVEYLWSAGYRSIGASCFVRPEARLDEARLRAGLSVLDPTPPVERPAK